MPELWTCTQGHTWERGAPAEGPAMACPTCGATKVRRVGGEPVALAEPPDREPPPDPSFARSSPSMPFTVVRPHAQGGLGQIALARDDRIMREVALKQILTVHADNPTLRKRFLYEARITGQLEHPSIVPVYCLGDDENGRPYYVMRFVRGRTLDDIITEHVASPNAIVFRELLRRFIAVCQAVAYAHARGVIHRDLKPSNIMLGDYGETLVLDWGLAKDIKNRSDPALRTNEFAGTKKESNGKTPSMIGLPQPAHELTMQGQIIGTPAYMAPEQAAGRTELHGPVTDIYALGGILYKILTGKSPSAAKGATGMNGAVKTLTFVESPAPSQVHPGVDPGLEAICRRGMATDPAHRYPRALEMAQEIQRWLDEHPLTSGPVTMGSRFMAWLRRIYPLVAILLLLTLIGLLAALLVHWRR